MCFSNIFCAKDFFMAILTFFWFPSLWSFYKQLAALPLLQQRLSLLYQRCFSCYIYSGFIAKSKLYLRFERHQIALQKNRDMLWLRPSLVNFIILNYIWGRGYGPVALPVFKTVLSRTNCRHLLLQQQFFWCRQLVRDGWVRLPPPSASFIPFSNRFRIMPIAAINPVIQMFVFGADRICIKRNCQ